MHCEDIHRKERWLKFPKPRIFFSTISGNFEGKLEWRWEVTETIAKTDIKPAKEQARDHCPLAPTAFAPSSIDMKGSC